MRVDEAREATIRSFSNLVCGDHLQSRTFSVENFILRTQQVESPQYAKSVMAMMLAACAVVKILRSPYGGLNTITPHAERLAADLMAHLPSPPPWAIEPIDCSDHVLEAEPYSNEDRELVVSQTEVLAERSHLRMSEIDADPLLVEEELMSGSSSELYADFAFLLCLNFRSVDTRLTPGRFEELLAQYVADSLRASEGTAED